ncbi:protein-L-isoaspartate O-methyltransferase family protein [Novosphingopyxis sp.]|uniref:protein-L-isoaspartate O-methyltransferase family protein n=1 Tax=Novosphingopyxis sp. TaxID=2709690 RepID=UPI003B5D043D
MNENNFQAMRDAMIDGQLRPSGVNDRDIVRAMASVPREEFVPETRASVAYADRSVPLGNGRFLAPPVALGRLLTVAEPQRSDTVLIVGAGTGYSAMVMAHLTGPVTALESDTDLLAAARPRLAGGAFSDLSAVQLVEGDLTGGYAANGPYDLILIDGAVETVPEALAAQLADGGRLICGLAEDGLTRLAVARKRGGVVRPVPFEDNEVPVLPGFARAKAFRF